MYGYQRDEQWTVVRRRRRRLNSVGRPPTQSRNGGYFYTGRHFVQPRSYAEVARSEPPRQPRRQRVPRHRQRDRAVNDRLPRQCSRDYSRVRDTHSYRPQRDDVTRRHYRRDRSDYSRRPPRQQPPPQRLQPRRPTRSPHQVKSDDPDFNAKVRIIHNIIKAIHHLKNVSAEEPPLPLTA